MGNNNSHERSKQCKAIRNKYFRLLEKSQFNFVKYNIIEDPYNTRLSSSCSILNEENVGAPVDWRDLFESYLEEKKDTYFWTEELLE